MTQLKPNSSFESINVGDEIPSFEIGETQATMDQPATNSRVPKADDAEPRKNIHNDADFAKSGLFGTTANAGVMTMAYVTQMLEQVFPTKSFYNGGRLTYKGINPFRDGDVVEFTGVVTGKRTESGKNFVDMEIKGIDKTGRLVGVAEASLVPAN